MVASIVALAGLLGSGLAGCGSQHPAGGSTVPSEGGGLEDATLGAGDVFDVRVYGEEDLSGSYRIDSDGSIDFPFVRRVEIAGLTPGEAADRIEKRLLEGEFLKDPQVSVFVKEYNSKRVSVVGAVSKDGSFPMRSGMTVVEAIGLAGGFTPLADRDGTLVIRKVDGKTRRIKVPVDDVTEGRAEDIVLLPGDIVSVPERLF
ncbi:MAG: polysaccharide biosynthesis/export family protein [Myxococcales bacterium]|nr:polysaccharide biosynthesis/export family protein [Myxococcales bacterium]